jgi:WXG100 family type VII secretion target
MTRVAVDLDRLAGFVGRLAQAQAQLSRARADADARLRQLHGGWAGEAARAQAAAHAQWRAGAAQVHDALAVLQSVARTAAANYTEAVQANRRMWHEA